MTSEKREWLQEYLREHRIADTPAILEEVSGGIVNNIYRVSDGKKTLILKEYARSPKFDPNHVLPGGRYNIEKAAYQLLRELFPSDAHTPQLVSADDNREVLILEDIGDEQRFDRKINLLTPEIFSRVGGKLAEIANKTYDRKDLIYIFNNTNFQELKNDIRYYRYIHKEPLLPLRDLLMKRAKEHRVVFLHDDLRFNNMLFKGSSFVFIDFEGAYFGDVALDIAHVLSELFLYYFCLQDEKYRSMIDRAWETFLSALNIPEDRKELEFFVTKHVGFGIMDRAQGVIRDDYSFVKDPSKLLQIGEKIVEKKEINTISNIIQYEY